MAMRPDAVSLAQGIVYWGPPRQALDAAARLLESASSVNSYGPNEGLPELRSALRHKLASRNNLHNYDVIVTCGANQAFVNVAITLLDETNRAVLFKPYYFDNLMTIQMLGGAARIMYGECDPVTMHPSLAWLKTALSQPDAPKLVSIVNPCNPTGVLLSKAELDGFSDACAAAGAWLVVDNTYEDFLWSGEAHYCPASPHVINLFSFSKAYGTMGWRVGYIAYPNFDGTDLLGQQFLKTQDTICICASQLSQHIALYCLKHGHAYLQEKLASLEGAPAPLNATLWGFGNRAALLEALSPLGTLGDGIYGGEGAIYYWARLPAGCQDDVRAVEWLVQHAGVCVVPGSSCGGPGYVRCSFANLPPEQYQVAAARLKQGLQHLVQHGMDQAPNPKPAQTASEQVQQPSDGLGPAHDLQQSISMPQEVQ